MQIAALSHQISSQRARILELEGEIADSEMRRKRAAAGSGGTSMFLFILFLQSSCKDKCPYQWILRWLISFVFIHLIFPVFFSSFISLGGGRSLRDDEEAFLREERLKDDLDLSRRQKLELEAALLDRDARAIESKFDLGESFF